MILMTAVAYAQVEPTVTNITYTNTGNFQFVGSIDGVMCIGISDHENWCYGNNYEYIWIYDKDTYEVTNPYNLTEDGLSGDLPEFCEFYEGDGYIYCFTSPDDNFKVDVATGTKTPLANRTPTDESFPAPSCDVRPNTDDIYCIGQHGGTGNPMRVYDIGTDSWTYPMNLNYSAFWLSCDFVDDDTWVCYGGYDGSWNTLDTLFEYHVPTNTTTIISTGQKFTSGSCNAISGILYCMFGVDDDAGTPLDEIFYYNATSNTFGTLSTTLPVEFVLYGHAGLMGTTIANMGGYSGLGYDNSNDIFEVYFDIPLPPEPEVEEWTPQHSISDVTGLVIDFGVEFGLQAIALAGLIALVGIAVWVRGRLR